MTALWQWRAVFIFLIIFSQFPTDRSIKPDVLHVFKDNSCNESSRRICLGTKARIEKVFNSLVASDQIVRSGALTRLTFTINSDWMLSMQFLLALFGALSIPSYAKLTHSNLFRFQMYSAQLISLYFAVRHAVAEIDTLLKSDYGRQTASAIDILIHALDNYYSKIDLDIFLHKDVLRQIGYLITPVFFGFDSILMLPIVIANIPFLFRYSSLLLTACMKFSFLPRLDNWSVKNNGRYLKTEHDVADSVCYRNQSDWEDIERLESGYNIDLMTWLDRVFDAAGCLLFEVVILFLWWQRVMLFFEKFRRGNFFGALRTFLVFVIWFPLYKVFWVPPLATAADRAKYSSVLKSRPGTLYRIVTLVLERLRSKPSIHESADTWMRRAIIMDWVSDILAYSADLFERQVYGCYHFLYSITSWSYQNGTANILLFLLFLAPSLI